MPSPTSRRRVSVTEHPNAATVRRLFDAFKAYDVAGVIDAIAEDAVWTFPGRRSKIAGEHRGREEVIKFLTKVMMLAGGTFSVKVHDIMASDDGAVVLFTGSAKRQMARAQILGESRRGSTRTYPAQFLGRFR